MSDRVMNALDSRFIERMREWARETLMPYGSTVPSAWPSDGPKGEGGRAGSRTPVLIGRAHDTEMAILALPIRYGQTVRQYWLYDGRSLRDHARRRQVDDHTFATWVIKGHELLKAVFRRDSERWKREHGLLSPARSA